MRRERRHLPGYLRASRFGGRCLRQRRRLCARVCLLARYVTLRGTSRRGRAMRGHRGGKLQGGAVCVGNDDSKMQPGTCMTAAATLAKQDGDPCDIQQGPWCAAGLSCVAQSITGGALNSKCQAIAAAGRVLRPRRPERLLHRPILPLASRRLAHRVLHRELHGPARCWRSVCSGGRARALRGRSGLRRNHGARQAGLHRAPRSGSNLQRRHALLQPTLRRRRVRSCQPMCEVARFPFK